MASLTGRVAQSTMSQGILASPRVSVARPFTSVQPRRASIAVHAQQLATAAVVDPAAPKKHYHPSILSEAAPAVYAVVEIGGSQLFVEPGKWYTCNRLAAEPGAKIQFGRVLALKKDGQLQVGRPFLEHVAIQADIVEELRAPKVLVYKMRPKKHYRKMQGHRQDLTKFMVTGITM